MGIQRVRRRKGVGDREEGKKGGEQTNKKDWKKSKKKNEPFTWNVRWQAPF